MKPEEILGYAMSNYEGLTLLYHLGEKGLFYNPGKKLNKGSYFITVKEESEECFRVNLLVSRTAFIGLFNVGPEKTEEVLKVVCPGGSEPEDLFIPHPLEGRLGWVSVLNPTQKSFKRLKPLLKDAYQLAKERFEEAWKKKTTSVMRRPPR